MIKSSNESDLTSSPNWKCNYEAGEIIKSEDLEFLRNAKSYLEAASNCLEDAEQWREQVNRESEFLLEEELEYQKQVLAKKIQSCFIEEQLRAREYFAVNIEALKSEISDAVTTIVQRLVGEIPDRERVKILTSEAVRHSVENQNAKILCALDVYDHIQDTVDSLYLNQSIKIRVSCDVALESGRVILTTQKGHIEIGTAALIENAIGNWSSMGSKEVAE